MKNLLIGLGSESGLCLLLRGLLRDGDCIGGFDFSFGHVTTTCENHTNSTGKMWKCNDYLVLGWPRFDLASFFFAACSALNAASSAA